MSTNAKTSYGALLNDLVKGIGKNEGFVWEKEKAAISLNIEKAVQGELSLIKGSMCDSEFLRYCNAIKSLLIIYNFGNLPTLDDFESDDQILTVGREQDSVSETRNECIQRESRDRETIKVGIERILNHVNGVSTSANACSGYDLTPYLSADDCIQIFKSARDDSDKIIPITFSAATVLTTLIYFRRAYKRLNLFKDEELITKDGTNLMERVVETTADILSMIYNFVTARPGDEKFLGWGVTLSPKFTRAITLGDTYAVVDALSRFADAFTQEGTKGDEEFIDSINQYVVNGGGESGFVDLCLDAVYKVALNVYSRTKEVYGKKRAFFVVTKKDGDKVRYEFPYTNYEQIASSNRSSALFNSLYTAMIAMYGYVDKEVVIRRFMEDKSIADFYYNKYELSRKDGGDIDEKRREISAYAANCRGYNDKKTHHVFDDDVKLLLSERTRDEDGDVDFGDNYKTYYDIARVFQKFLEDKHPEELSEIAEYRDFFNSTKDAIDQISLLYRDFENSQRLGIVDTDYMMYSELDVAVSDKINLSKLNKANIAINYIRPLLLSAKIMIVNALTKYPQADLKELYYNTKNKRHIKVSRKSKDRQVEWLWNEDNVDMNSTARHCEAIAYDYFDYYDKYELGFTALKNLRNSLGSIGDEIDLGSESSDVVGYNFRRLILDLTGQNLDKIKDFYQKKLSDKDVEISRLQKQIDDNEKKYIESIESTKKQYDQRDAENARKFQEILNENKHSFEIGETTRRWIKDEIEHYLKKISSIAIINILNGNGYYKGFGSFDIERLLNMDGIVDANLEPVRETWNEIVKDCSEGDRQEKIKKYVDEFRQALMMQEILSAAYNGLLESQDYYSSDISGQDTLESKNYAIYHKYRMQIREGKNSGHDNENKEN